MIGIDASATPDQTRAQILRIARRTADMVGLGRAIEDADVTLDTRYAYPAYGLPSAETNEAIRLCARLEGMMTDPVYEGKSMQGMVDKVRRGEFPAGSRVLYAHLGGAGDQRLQLSLPQRLSRAATRAGLALRRPALSRLGGATHAFMYMTATDSGYGVWPFPPLPSHGSAPCPIR